MKPFLLIITLCLSVSAQSIKDGDKITAWTYLAFSQNDTVRAYIAPESIRRGDERIRVWFRADLPQGSNLLLAGTNFYSVRVDAELDCSAGRARAFKTLLYDRDGRLVAKEGGEDWVKETPNSIGWAVFQYFCEYSEHPPTNTPPILKPKP